MMFAGQEGYRYDDKHLQEIIQQFTKQGFTEEQVIQAWQRSNCRPDQISYHLMKNQSLLSQQKEEEKMIQQAIELSIRNQNETCIQDAENYLRTEDPIGLQNLGRTCYFNSFLQTLYHIRELRDPILKLELSENNENVPEQRAKLNEMLKQFQLTFAAMLKSQKNFTDPTDLFEVLKGLSGQIYKQGEENDFWEFQNSTLEYLEQSFMKESEIDTADLFKSYLRLQNNSLLRGNSSTFTNSKNIKLQNYEYNNNNNTNNNNNSSITNVNNDQIKKQESNMMDEEFIIYDTQQTLATFTDNQASSMSTTIVDSENNKGSQVCNSQLIQESNKLSSSQLQSQSQERQLSLQKQESNKKKAKKLKNPITELFFGVGEEKVTIYSQENNSIEVKVHDIPIGIFNLDAKMGDLYAALNSYFQYQVADYQPEPVDNLTQSVIIKKQKKVDIALSIKTAPKILNFYINRIFYNKELNCAEKLNKKFTFDKEIYIDNYIQGKDKEFEEQKKQIETIDNQLTALENKLSKFDNYINQEGNSGSLPVLSAMNLIKSYFQTQVNKQDNFIDIEEIISDVIHENDNVDVGVLGQKQQLIQMIQTLDQYYLQIKKNKDVLEKKIKELKDQKQYWQNQNKTIKYELFSILIHQGYANTGHYYCFIYDDKKQCWYKFNDSIVTKVTEEEVFKQSYGDQDNNCNACCLFYKNSQTKVNPNKPVEISARLKAEVQKKDQAFLEKIDEIKIRRKLQEVKQDFLNYTKEIKEAQYKIQLNKNANNIFTKFYNCTNFKFYLFNSNEQQIQGFGKRTMLMETIEKQDFSQLEQSLAKKENLYQGIILFYEHMQLDQGVCGQILNDQEKRELHLQEQIYTNILKFLNIIANILNDNNNYINNFRIMGSLRKMLSSQAFSNYSSNVYFNLIKFNLKYIHEVFILKSCFMIDKYFHQGQLPSAFSLLNQIVLTYLQFYYVEKVDSEKQKKDSQNDKNQINMIKSSFESPEFSSNIGTQLYNNLKQTKFNFEKQLGQDEKSKLDGQINLLQSPEKFPQSKNRCNQVFEEIILEKDININDSEIVFKVYDQYEIFLKRSDVWIQQLKKLQIQKFLIPQEERLSQEEVLYFD
ncbi:ubiquitin carboxy-terminal hydrolase (macronuclear) [Tetrahymena thermophila SB210]|uniref:Ubiquitin carboxy-terminal hydrolase n=1 Tax=Tetrahymena thermophila (strain SB210) TaxID=312017 RepID=I7LSW9_TETTS|nr:ubiquitin carboxy-terminal hydrolase [Tetrahymena thermophila SB210]EAR83769.2 ubiquitin carboxy-terminal hydrolase [Tetrahymena thermophila SB210]|eukprot:XP_001031432.2 ubiquitin carboxy-terminal hydrolase [Tetrahymena thermophila SB210]